MPKSRFLTDEELEYEARYEAGNASGLDDDDESDDAWEQDDDGVPPELRGFVAEGYIGEVLHVLKSGKEATAYCCTGGPLAGMELVAAKIYRPRQGRAFKNDAIYREGRVILDQRVRRAVEKKSRTGREFGFGMWVHEEWEVLKRLHAAGAMVPRPIKMGERAILMEYVGDRDEAAPQLHHVRLEPEPARRLFDRLVRDIALWLTSDVVHADLSAYNILYWEGKLTVIDFPQAVDPRFNRQALTLLTRDVENVCRHFRKYGVHADGARIASGIWGRYIRADLRAEELVRTL